MSKGFLLILIFLTACRERVIHDLTELEANKIISNLHQIDIDSKKEEQADGFWAISVPKSKVITAIRLIENARFIKKPKPEQITAKLLSSDNEQKLIYERALAQQLEATLQSLSGVLEAHVHLNINQDQGLWKKTKSENDSSSAAILIIVNEQFILTSEEISELISGAAGVKAERINVVINYPQLIADLNDTAKTFLENESQINKENISPWKSLLIGVIKFINDNYAVLISLILSLIVLIRIFIISINRHKIKKFKNHLAT